MSGPDDEDEPDDWGDPDDSSIWGDEPIERPGAFDHEDEEAEPDRQPDPIEPHDDEAPSHHDAHPLAPRSPPDEAPSHHDTPPLAPRSPPDEPIATPLRSDELPDTIEPPDEPDLTEQTAALTPPPSLAATNDPPLAPDPLLDTQVEIAGAATPASKRAPEPRPSAPPIEVQVAALLADPGKRIVGDLHWSADEDGAQGREFLAPVRCAGAELRVRGQRCAAAGSLRFSLLSRALGRVAALDLGHPHRTADGRLRGETHFHRRDDPADHPSLPPLDADDIAGAWRLFCALTNITHDGELGDPPPVQETLL